MPLLSQLPVRFDDLFLLSRPGVWRWTGSVEHTQISQFLQVTVWRLPPLDPQDLVVVSFLGLFEKSLGSLQAFFNLTVIFTVFGSCLVVPDS